MDSEKEEKTIADPAVLTKYSTAGEIAKKCLQACLSSCVESANVLSICELGDRLIREETAKVYNKTKVSKGIAFPTCVSVNEVICHFSPLLSDPQVILVAGDVVKVDLGCHIDGFIASVAHTVVIGHSNSTPLTGKKADCLQAAYLCSEAALRLLRPGNSNQAITEVYQKITDTFKCNTVEGIVSYQLKQNVIDGEKTIFLGGTESHKKENKCTIEVNDVFAVDILVSTGDGKPKSAEERTTIFKRTANNYNLKMKASRALLNEVTSNFGEMPFNLRNLEDEKKARMGLAECLKHEVMESFSVLKEKEGEYVFQIKFTVAITANGPIRITQGPAFPGPVVTKYKIADEEVKSLLESSIKIKNKAAKPASQ